MKNFNKMYFYTYYRLFGRIPCPYCYRNTYAGLKYRHARSLGTKKALAKHVSKRYLAA